MILAELRKIVDDINYWSWYRAVFAIGAAAVIGSCLGIFLANCIDIQWPWWPWD